MCRVSIMCFIVCVFFIRDTFFVCLADYRSETNFMYFMITFIRQGRENKGYIGR